MATIEVLLAGGRAAGRIVEVAEDATEYEATVVGLATAGPEAVTSPLTPPPPAKQRYAPTAETASGYPVWRLSEG